MFNFVMRLPILALVLSLFAVAYALPVFVRDVFVPQITSPKHHAMWPIGSKQNVTWNISNAPVSITNPIGQIILAKADRLDIEHPLASNFSILDGWHIVTVPNVPLGFDYSIVLFGDSGDMSPKITIIPVPGL